MSNTYCMSEKITPLKRWLFENQKTNRELAKDIKADENGLSLIVNGKRLPSLKLALKIAKGTGVSVEELFGYCLEEGTE